MNKLPERLKTIRKEKKETQEQIAEKLNVNRVTYTCWETGKHQPNIDQLIDLSKHYKVSVDYLVGRVD